LDEVFEHPNMTKEAVDLIDKLMAADPLKRLGAGQDGSEYNMK